MKSIENYIKVIEYLDNFEAKLLSKYRSEITCSKNCSDCCILKTVFPIEAYYIYTNNQSVEVAVMETNHCEFLKDNSCQIYAYRTIISR